MNYRYSVITYNFGNYEIIHEVEEKDPEAEYILITDLQATTSETWNVIFDPELNGLTPFDKVLKVRYDWFKYCTTNICIRVDGSIAVKKSLKPLIDIFEEDNYDISLMPHPCRDNFLDEYKAWIEIRGYNPDQAQRCINSMRGKGYDFSYKGMFQLGLSIQRKDDINIELNNKTLSYLKKLGTSGNMERIDQIPFSFIMNTEYSHFKVLPLSEQVIRSYYMQFYEHHSSYQNLNMFYDYTKDDERYVFNKKVKCLYLQTPQDCVRFREQDLQEDVHNGIMKNKELEAVKASLQEHISQKHSEIVHLQADKSNLLSQIDNLNASAKEQSKVIEELKTELIAQTNNTEYLSYKNRKHLKQLRVLITLLAVSLIGLTISILL